MVEGTERMQPFGLVGFNDVESDVSTKVAHDRYEVYVNDDFIGHKTLLNQNEDITDVNDFLRAQGLTNFKVSLDGDHYNIQAEEERRKISDALNIYLQNR